MALPRPSLYAMASRMPVALTITLVWWAAPAALRAQFDFTIGGRPVQVHSFLSEGFLNSNDNNYLTMNSSRGTFEMTDVGMNAIIQLNGKFRVGVQVYDRNFGNLGQWHPQLDWAVADYSFKDWFGIRCGVVKNVFGLDGDTQDVDSLQTFALLPQSVYPTDLRDALLRHRGGDVYGSIPLKRLGSLSYTAYAGLRQDSMYGGYPYLFDEDIEVLGTALIKNVPLGGKTFSGVEGHLTRYGGLQVGEDLRWNTPLSGLLAGASHAGADIHGAGQLDLFSTTPTTQPVRMAFDSHSKREWTNQFYGQYLTGKWRLASEYRRYWQDQIILGGSYEMTTDVRGWYVAGAYRISKRLEGGAYYSRSVTSWVSTVPGFVEASSQSSPDRHLYDKVITLRVDLTRWWNIKIEGHFMDGHGGMHVYPSGFYSQENQ